MYVGLCEEESVTVWLNHNSVMFYRVDERPAFTVVEPRLREYYYDIAQ